MSQITLQRLGGAALLVGGILFAIGNLLHPTEHSAEAHEAATWATAHIMFMIGMLGILLGLPSLYASQAQRSGVLGLVGYTAFFVGVAWTLGGSWFEAFGIPSLDEPSIHEVEHGSGLPFNAAFGLAFVLGQIAFGYALYRTHAFSRVATLAIAISGIVLVPGMGMTGPIAGVLLIGCTAILGFALALLGRGMMISAGAPLTAGESVLPAPTRSIA